MKRSAAGLPLAMCFFLLCACSSPKLTKQAAYDEISRRHVPTVEIIYFDGIPENTVLGGNVNQLINNGFFIKTESMNAVDMYVVPDEAGRGKGTAMHHHYKKYYRVTVPVARTKIGEVTEIIEDSLNDMAVAVYTVILDPIEPYYSELCIDSNCGFYGDWLKKTTTKNIYFRHFDGGWKIVR